MTLQGVHVRCHMPEQSDVRRFLMTMSNE